MKTRLTTSRLKRLKSLFSAITIASQLLFIAGPIIPLTAHADDIVPSAPSLTTDKPDYAPGDVAHISGSNFVAGSTVTVTVIAGAESDADYLKTSGDVTVDTQGAFVYDYQLENFYRPFYWVMASDADGTILAQTTFTDSGSVVMWNQCENNKTGTLGNCGWTSGNLTAAHNSLFEGMATHQEVVMTGLSTGVHTLRFGVETTKSGNHAYDWIVSDAQAIQAAAEDGITTTLNPCTGGSSGNNATCATLNSQTGLNHAAPSVPDDSFISVDGSTQTRINGYETHFGNRTIDLYSNQPISGVSLTLEGHCGNKTGASCNPIANGGDTGDTFLWYSLTWTSTGTAALLRAAADIGLGGDGTGRSWGAGRGATGVSGSPYHFYLNTLDGTGGSLDNQMAAGAVFVPPVPDSPTVATNIHLGTNHTTDVQGTTVALGSTIHDKATVTNAGGTNGTPLGTATFQFFNNGTCANTPTATSSALALSGGVVDATGFAQGPLTAGAYSFKASYTSSDTTKWNNAVGPCETVTVGQGTSTLATTLHKADHTVVAVGGNVPLGTDMHDLATVTPSSSFAATGNVDFRFYTSLAACTGDTNFTGGTAKGSIALAANVAHPSTSTGALTPGTYAFKAKWAGDANYTGSTSACENFTVNQSTSSITTTLHNANHDVVAVGGHVDLGTVMHDLATVTPGGTIAPTGNVTFALFASNDCSGQGTAMGSVALNGANPGVAHPSNSTAALAAGDYSFQATWAGDANYTGNISSCENFTVNKAQLTVDTTVHDAAHTNITNGSVALGSVVHDTATVTGAVSGFTAPTPTFTMTSGYTGTCSAGSAVANNGTEGSADKSADSAALGAGAYAYRGAVAGNANYLGDVSDCEPFTVNKAQLTVTTIVHNALHADKTNSNVPLGSVMHDTAAVTGGLAGFAVPTPTFTMTSSYTDSCSAGAAVANDGTDISGDTKSADSNPLAAGTYAYRGAVAGNANYEGDVSPCEPFTVDKAQLSISTNVHDASHADVTNTAVPLGSILHDTATVTGQVAGFSIPTPTFTMTSNFIESCSAGSAVANNGMEGSAYKTVDSAALSAGSYAYMGAVAGNDNYLGSNSTCEPVTVNKANLSITTDIHNPAHNSVVTVPLGTAVHDTANVTGQVGSIAPTGAVTFYFGPGVAESCKDINVYPVIATAGSPDAGNGNPRSIDTAALAAGNYQFWAHVAGDANYLGSDSGCEPLTVNKAQLTVTTEAHDASHADITNGNVALGSITHDTATVTGGVSGFAVPTPTFTMTSSYTDSCANGSAVANDGTDAGNGANKSADSSALIAGKYAYQGNVAGNSNYIGDTSDCEPFTVNQSTSSITTEIHVDGTGTVVPVTGSVARGTSLHDKASVTADGAFNPTGSAAFTFFNNYSCDGVGTSAGTVGLTNTNPGIAHPSDSTGGLSAGQYSFNASWAGDSNYTGNISTCENFNVVDASISLSPATATNAINQPHTITAHVTKNDGTGVTDAVGVTVTFSITGSATFVGGDNDCVTDASGMCSVDINSSTTGGNTINATTTFDVNGVSLTRATDGDFGPDGSGSVTKTYVNAKISITPATATNEVNDPHNFTVTVMADDGSGSGMQPVNGALVNVLVSPSPSSFDNSDCIDGTNASGQCVVTINSTTAGTFTAHARTTIVVGGVTFKLATNGLGDNSGPAVKKYVDLKINIDSNSTNEVDHSHTFTVTVMSDPGTGTFGPVVGSTVTPGVTGTGSLTGAGTCETGTTDALGQCTIIVNSPDAGVATVSASTTVSVDGVSMTRSLGDGLSSDSAKATKTWVDASIALSPLEASNAINQPHTITAHVTKNDGSGVTDAAGVTVTFSVTTGSATFVSGVNTCVTNASGTCSIQIISGTTGNNTIDASTSFSVGGVSLTRATNGNSGPDGTGSAAKKYVNARITITPANATNEVGQQHTFTVEVDQDTGAGFVPVPAGTLANAIVSPLPTSFDATDCTNGVDANGQCAVTITSNTAGVFTIIARSTVVVEGVTFKLQTNGTGDNSGPATKTYVDANIVLSPLTATNNIGDAHTITATVMKNPGTGSVPAAGVLVTFSLLNNTASADFIPTSGDNTCTTNASGQCSVQINTLTPGSVDIHATTTFSVGGVSLTRATGDGLSGDSTNANKLYVAGSLQVCKAIALGNYPFSVNTSFDVVVTGPSYPSGHHLTFTVTNGVVSGCQTLTPLIPGSYAVNETDPGVAWTVTGNGGVTVVANQTPSKTITNTLKQPHTTISIASNTQETAPGENVILTITETNDGNVPLTNPSVTLTYGATTVTLDKTHFYVSGDTGNDGIMGVGETWTWSYTAVIGSDTTFTVAGHGTDPLGNDITTNHYPSEGGSVTVKVVGTTRTLGFWQTHTTFTSWVFANKLGSSMPIGTAPHKGVLTTAAQVFGGFYAPIAKTTTGAKRSPEDQARITLLQQLLAAKLNCAAFGCSASVQSSIAGADAAYAAGNKTAIMNYVGILDAYNNSGDSGAIPGSLPATGSATPSTSKSIANLSFWDLP